MKKVLKILITCTVVLSMLLFIGGCGSQSVDDELQVSPYDAVYSNLLDLESQEVLRVALKNSGVQKNYVEALLESIVKYNNATGSVLPVQNGFEVFAENTAYSYDNSKLEKKWKKKYNNLTGRKNCRITAFEAMGSLILYDSSFRVTETMMLIETQELSVFQSDSDIEKFSALFNGIETAQDISATTQEERIKEYWRQCGIGFEENGNASLISIWFNGPDIHSDVDRHVLHCGHAAVMIHTENDGVLLLEKLSYTSPYQLIKFPSEDQALRYIVDFNCVEIDESGIIPVVFVNDHVLRMQEGSLVY